MTFFYLLIFILLMPYPSTAYIPPLSTFTGYRVDDLFRYPSDFDSWTPHGLLDPSVYTYNCDGTQILGGYQIYGTNIYYEKTYTGLPIHDLVRYRMRFFFMDDWQPTDTFVMSFDGIEVTKPNLGAEKTYWKSSVCGDPSSTDSTFYDVIGNIPHSANSITVRLGSTLKQSAGSASIGFRRFSMQFVKRTSYDVVNNYCVQAYDYSTPPSDSCKCTANYQTYWDSAAGECKACHSSCAFCGGPTEYDCYKCIGSYALYDGKCSPCNPACFDCFGPNVNQCNSCTSGNYIYPDHTCSSTCPAERQGSSGHNYCKSTCKSSQYMLANDTCVDSCDSPMIKQSSLIGNLCLNPCDDPNLYIYYNGSCSSTCDTPFVSKATSLYKTCNLPCPQAQNYYYKTTGQCKSTCDFGYQVEKVPPVLYCVSIFNQNFSVADIHSAQQTASTLAAGGQATGTAMKAMSSMNSGSPSFAFLIGLSQMIQFIKYINITYPPKVQLLLLAQGSNPMSLSFGIDMPSVLQKRFQNHTLPLVFERYQVGSNFLVNYWNSLISLSLILFVIFLLAITTVCTKKYKTINFVSSKLLSIFKWDLLLMLFCSSIGDLTFYSYLDFQSNKFDSAASVTSFLFALGFNICFILLLIKTLKIAYHSNKYKEKSIQNGVQPKLDFEAFQFLYIEFHNKSFSQLAFMFYFLCRIYLFNIIITTFSVFPIMQCLLITGLTIMMLLYLIFKRPLKKKWDLIYMIINELIVLIINISVLMIAMSTTHNPNNLNSSNQNLSLQNVIITCNMIFGFLALASVGVQVSLMIIQMVRMWKKLRARGIKSIKQMIVISIFGKYSEAENKIYAEPTSDQRTLAKRRRLRIKRDPSGTPQTKQPTEEKNQITGEDLGISHVSLRRYHHNSRAAYQKGTNIFESSRINLRDQSEDLSYGGFRGLDLSQQNANHSIFINQHLTLKTDPNNLIIIESPQG